MKLSPDLLSVGRIGKSPKSRRRPALIAGSLELQDWDGIPNEAGNEMEGYLPSTLPFQNVMILTVTVNSESHLQMQRRYLMLRVNSRISADDCKENYAISIAGEKRAESGILALSFLEYPTCIAHLEPLPNAS